MDEEGKAMLNFIVITFMLIGAIICALSYESIIREKHNCQIEGMRANRTVLEIKEICQ
jgi:hypothetical protein